MTANSNGNFHHHHYHKIREVFGRIVESGTVIPAGNLEITVISLVCVDNNTNSYICQTFIFVKVTEIILQMPQCLSK